MILCGCRHADGCTQNISEQMTQHSPVCNRYLGKGHNLIPYKSEISEPITQNLPQATIQTIRSILMQIQLSIASQQMHEILGFVIFNNIYCIYIVFTVNFIS